MKTLVIDGIFFQLNEWSGIAKYWRTLLKGLNAIASQDKELRIVLLARGNSSSLRNANYSNIHVIPFSYFDPVCALSDFNELGELCKNLEASVFISSYYTLAYGVPNIGMAYDFIPEALGWMDQHTWKIKQIYMRSLTNCLSISRATADAASLYYPSLVCEDLDIFYPALEGEECTRAGKDAIKRLRIKYQINHPYAAVVGHRGNYKNIDLLHAALEKRSSSARPIALGIIATAGEDLTQYEIDLYERHFQFGIKRLELETIEMPPFLGGAELLFYPSLLEGFGYPVAESMIQGCPVITTGSTSINEILALAKSTEYRLISGYDSDEALHAIISMMHKRQRVSLTTTEQIKRAFGKSDAERFLERLLKLSTTTNHPEMQSLNACLCLDGLLA